MKEKIEEILKLLVTHEITLKVALKRLTELIGFTEINLGEKSSDQEPEGKTPRTQLLPRPTLLKSHLYYYPTGIGRCTTIYQQEYSH